MLWAMASDIQPGNQAMYIGQTPCSTCGGHRSLDGGTNHCPSCAGHGYVALLSDGSMMSLDDPELVAARALDQWGNHASAP
jgi:hypothetical protein